MTASYGIKISRPGYDVNTAAPNHLSFSSAYKTLKVHASGSGSLTDAARTATIAHGLGYVPFFMVHTTMDQGFGSSLFSAGEYVLTPAGLGGILSDPSVGVNDDLLAYADATNLYIKAQANFGKVICKPSSSNDMGDKVGSSYFAGQIITGKNTNVFNGAVRVTNVNVAQGTTITKAQLFYYVDFIVNSGGNTLKTTIYGMNEDNTADLAADPFGRPNTTATYNYNRSIFSNQYFGLDITNIVQEIINRGGWASGNAMGFKILDNGSSDHVLAEDDYSGTFSTDAYLEIIFADPIANYKYTIFKNQIE